MRTSGVLRAAHRGAFVDNPGISEPTQPIATTYTRSAGKAQRFPGVKSARAMRDKLGESHLIHDERGNVIE